MFHYFYITNKYDTRPHYLKYIKDRRRNFWDNIEKTIRTNENKMKTLKYYNNYYYSIYDRVSFDPRIGDYHRLNDKLYSKKEITKDEKFIQKTELDDCKKIILDYDKNSESAKKNTIIGVSSEDYFTNWEKSYINFYNSPYKQIYSLPYGNRMVKEDYDILELQDYGFGWKESKDMLKKNEGDVKKTLKQLILENKEKKNKIFAKNLKELTNYGYNEEESQHALKIVGNDLKLSIKYLISKEKYI